MFKNMISILTVAGLVLVLAPTAHADIISFQEGVSPTAGYTHDAVMIRSNDADANQNDVAAMFIGLAEVGNEILRGLFEFDVSDIPTSNQIDSVSLVLTTLTDTQGINNVGGAGALTTFDVHTHAFDIDETTATWNVPGGGAPAGGTLGTFLTSTSFNVELATQTVTFGDTGAFRTAVSDALADDGILRLIVANNDETNLGKHDFARFFDETAATTDYRPELTVTHTPEPATMSLLALGGLAILRRRRRTRA